MGETFGKLLGHEIRERREARALTQRELADEAFDPGDKIESAERRVRELEAGQFDNPRAKTYQPVCDFLDIPRALIRSFKEQAANRDQQEETERDEFVEDAGPIKDALAHPEGLTRAQLVFLSELFGHEAPERASDDELPRFLTLKAEQHQALKAEVDAIDDGLKRLSNLKAAAQDAIARVDLDEVEALLSRVQEVELEEAAKTAELRANNALLRGRVDQAYRILSAAADSFGSIDPLEPARKRILSFFAILRNHGVRYGGAGLPLSLELLAPVLTDELKAQNAWLWAAGENWRGAALQEQGIRTDGQAGADLLAEAVAAYRAALEVRTRAEHPVDWAMTQNNLGNALSQQGIRTDGQAGADLLAEAVAAYRAALEVRTRAAFPVDWAMTQECIAITLLDRSKRPDAEDPQGDLHAARTAVEGALEVFDPEHMSYGHAKASRLRELILAALDAAARG